jgi:hypothetical protein
MSTSADINLSSTADIEMALDYGDSMLPELTDETMLGEMSEPPDDMQTEFTGFSEPELSAPVTLSKFYGEGASCATEAECADASGGVRRVR